MPLPKATFAKSHPILTFLILSIFAFSLTNAEVDDFYSTLPVKTYPVTTGTPHFEIDLDYPQAFEVKIDAFNGNSSETGFCSVTPSKVVPKLLWTGPVNNAYQELDPTGLTEKHSYDNIEFHMGYYFILDSLTFEVTAIKDFKDQATYYTIKSEIPNDDDEEQLEDTYMIIDPDQHNLYIITRKKLLYYSLTDFVDAVEKKKAIPSIKNQASNYTGYDMILSMRYYRHRLYIVADNFVQVFLLGKNGELTFQLNLDHTFFEEEEVSIQDIAFKGNYGYVLDQLRGVLVIDISNEDKPHTKKKDKYLFEQYDTRETQKGQFIEIVGDSLHIVSAGSRRPYVFEYIIRGDPELLSLDFNRKFELIQTVRDSYSDSNYLYLLTGFFNIVTKHSIPGRFQSADVEDYLVEYWPVFGANAMTSQTQNYTSTVAVLNDDQITLMEFSEVNPRISCQTSGVPAGMYSYKVSATVKDCEERSKAVYVEFKTVCVTTQEIQLTVIESSANVGDTAEDKKTVDFLAIGIGLMIFLMVLFICLFSKYRSQYRRLEDRIKFHNLENVSTDHNAGGKGSERIGSIDEVSPGNARLQAQYQQKKKSPNKEKYEEKSKSGTTSEEDADKPFH